MMNAEPMPDPGPAHPVLSPDEDAVQRGAAPPGAFGLRVPPVETEPDPNWTPTGSADRWKGQFSEIGRGRRPRREDVYPYLLIRAMSPGDRARRPLWPPVPCWESPDILLIDATWAGEFSRDRLVTSPIAGRSYRVFIRIWNLGRFPAAGVHVRAWFVNPGFFGPGNAGNPAYAPALIGGAFTDLADRTRQDATVLVELDRAWDIPPGLTGHECLVASVSCPADPWNGAFDANQDRHVAQRNLQILQPTASLAAMVRALGPAGDPGAMLEVTLGGPAVEPVLAAAGGGTIMVGDVPRQVIAPAQDDIAAGLRVSTGRHWLTIIRRGQAVVAIESVRLAKWARAQQWIPGPEAFADPGEIRRVIGLLTDVMLENVGTVIDVPPETELTGALAHDFDREGMTAGALADRLGGPPNACHLLRLTISGADGTLVGGYSVVLPRP